MRTSMSVLAPGMQAVQYLLLHSNSTMHVTEWLRKILKSQLGVGKSTYVISHLLVECPALWASRSKLAVIVICLSLLELPAKL